MRDSIGVLPRCREVHIHFHSITSPRISLFNSIEKYEGSASSDDKTIVSITP